MGDSVPSAKVEVTTASDQKQRDSKENGQDRSKSKSTTNSCMANADLSVGARGRKRTAAEVAVGREELNLGPGLVLVDGSLEMELPDSKRAKVEHEEREHEVPHVSHGASRSSTQCEIYRGFRSCRTLCKV